MTNGEDQAAADFDVETPGESSDEETHDPANGATDLDAYQKQLAELTREQEQSADEDDSAVEEEGDEERDQEEEEESESDTNEETEADEAEEPEEEDDDAAEKASRYRIQTNDPVEAEALALRKRHRDWPLEKCLAKAKEILGVEATSTDEAEVQDTPPSRSVAEARDELKELRRQRNEALKAVELEEAAEISDRIDALSDEIEELRVTEAIRDKAQEQKLEAAYESSKGKAVKFYPDVTDAKSALIEEMERIDRRLKDTDNPLFYDPDKPFKLTQMAANKLGIAPVDPDEPAAPKSQRKVVRRPAHQPASGSRRSANPAAPAKKVDDAISGLGSLDAYEDFVASL